MLTNKKGELGFVSLLALLFSSVLFVSAVVINSTNNPNSNITLNTTLPNVSIDNLSLINDSIVVNATLINETINLVIPIENVSLANETFNLPIPIENLNLTNQSTIAKETTNLTIPIGNISSINETTTLTLNETLNNQTNITVINQSINISEGLISVNLSNITILNYSTIMTENHSINNISKLAKIFNEDNLDFDKEIRLKYLEKNNNFSSALFTNITGKTDFKLNVGAKQDKIRGISINSSNFVIDLLYCELNGRYCAFRVNGVPAAKLHSSEEFGNTRKNSFDMDGNYVLKVNSIIAITEDFAIWDMKATILLMLLLRENE